MRILYFSQYFPPEVGATQTRAFEMARFLISRGHHVTVVTEVPNHPSGIIPPAYRGRLVERSQQEGIDVLRLWVWASPNKDFSARMRFYLSYMSVAAIAGSLARGRFDLVYATSPPLFVGAAGLAAATVRQIPFIFEVRDLWPESAVALGELSNRKAIGAAEALEKVLYGRARRVVAVTRGIQSRLVSRGLPSYRIELIPNGANTDLFKYTEEGRQAVRSRLGLDGKFVAMYAGIHGIAQGLETILQAAAMLRQDPRVRFVLVGEGPRKAALQNMANELLLHNVTMLPEVPAAEMPAYLSAADCALVPLQSRPIFRGALPSKMFEAWACERPVVLSVQGEAEALLREAGGGLVCRPDDPESLAIAIRQLAATPAEARTMGIQGREYVTGRYSRRDQARLLEELLLKVSEEAATSARRS